MAYFGYPATYQPYYPQFQQNTPVLPQNNAQNGVIWVSGEQAAKSYLVAPNSTVVLFDSESQTIFLQSADASGMPSIKVLDYTVRDSAKNSGNTPVSVTDDKSIDYATKADIDALKGQIESIKMRVGKLAKKEDVNE